MKTIQMGLNTEPDFIKADEVIARFKESNNQSGVEMWERMRKASEALRDKIAETVSADGAVELNWDCTGETRFYMHANQWKNAMPQFRFEIDRYSCKVFKD
jgi:hypothetical protein